MATTNHTDNYELSQYIGTDITSYLSNYNGDMQKIDAQMKVNADDAATAMSDAASAVIASEAAIESAGTALTTAQSANTAAEAAQTAASGAQTAAGTAQTDAAAALRASASNSITNLAPAYDPTLTYDVGDLVTYIDTETNTGKLYKCIVAVTTPMAFNLNFWDDVTTSEVYAQRAKIAATVTADGVKTTAQLLSDLYNAAGVSLNKEYLLVIKLSNFTRILHMSDVDADSITFSMTEANFYPLKNRILTMLCASTDVTSHASNCEMDSNGTTITSISDTVNNDSRVYTLYELMTI